MAREYRADGDSGIKGCKNAAQQAITGKNEETRSALSRGMQRWRIRIENEKRKELKKEKWVEATLDTENNGDNGKKESRCEERELSIDRLKETRPRRATVIVSFTCHNSLAF